MDLYSLLIDDHNKVKALFKEALADKENIDKSIVNKICDELLLHMEKEERFLYPEVLKMEAVSNLGKEAIEEHKEGKNVIQMLQENKLSKIKYTVKVEILQLEIEHHVKEEETELFPKLKKLLSKQQTDEIAKKVHAFTDKNAGKTLVASK